MGLNEDVERARLRAAELAKMSDAQRVDRLSADLAEMTALLNIAIGCLDNAEEECEALRAELATMTERAEKAEDTIGDQTDLERDFSDCRKKLAEANARIAELERQAERHPPPKDGFINDYD